MADHDLKVYNGSTWDAGRMKVWNGSSWDTVAKYYNGSAWNHLYDQPSVTISAACNGDTNSRIIGTTCDVGVQFNSDGEEYEQLAGGAWSGTSQGTWLDSGSGADAWVEFVRTSGVTRFDNHASSTRVNMASTVHFTLRAFDVETVSVIGYFRFWDAASGGNILQTTSSATWQATSNDGGGMCSLC